MRQYGVRVCLSVAMGIVLAACDDEPPEAIESVRPIRAFTVTSAASGQVRNFTAVVEASDSSDLSFQIGGNVLEVQVNQGDQVTAGQVLAVLDQEPFELNVQAAEANLQQARADAEQNKAEFERQKTLYEQGWVARARFDNAQRDYRTAVSRVDYAVARANLAGRDLANTTLAAPFDGFIAGRSVDPFVEVRPGEKAFQIDAEGGLEAAFGVPETVIARVYLGMPVNVAFARMAGMVDAIVTEVGSAAGAGNAFAVRAALIEPPATILPGMSADVTLLLADDATGSGYLVPLTAVAPGGQDGEGFVFVYDPATSTVRRTPVAPTHSLAANVVAVTGIEAGDIVATAGVNFLVDGQNVRLMEQAASGG